jgi:hypothetical protein
MSILPTNARVKFGNKDAITGKIVGHGTMLTPSRITVVTYAIELDDKFQGYIGDEKHPNTSFISTLLVCADGVTRI